MADCQGKRRFDTEHDAEMALIRIRATSTEQRLPCRWYWCHKCDGWHLTAMPLADRQGQAR